MTKELFIKIAFIVLLLLSLCLICKTAFAQEAVSKDAVIKQDISASAVSEAKVGDILVRQGAVETIKADVSGKLTSKIYTSPQWDDNGKALLSHDDITGKTTSRGRYVKYVPDTETAKLEVVREKGNASIKEYWTVPDASVSKLSWTVETDAPEVRFNGSDLQFMDSLGEQIFETPAPVAWDADKKPVGITVEYKAGVLTYTILPGDYRYPVTVDPSTVIAHTAVSGRLNGWTNSGTYNSIRNGTSSDSYNALYRQMGQYYQNPVYSIYRVLDRYNTSTMPAYTAIDSAKVRMVLETDNSDTDFSMRICDTTDSLDTGHLNVTMWDEIKGWAASGAYSPTYLSDDAISTAGKSAGDTLAFKFNAAGLTNFNYTGTTQFWILGNNDIAGTAPTGNEYIVCKYNVGYIQIWYTAPSSGSTQSKLFRGQTYIWKNDPVYLWKR